MGGRPLSARQPAVPRSSALFCSTASTSGGRSVGLVAMTSAATAAVVGLAKDVPLTEP